jgi:hypothetical protein
MVNDRQLVSRIEGTFLLRIGLGRGSQLINRRFRMTRLTERAAVERFLSDTVVAFAELRNYLIQGVVTREERGQIAKHQILCWV